ncbi:MAG: hypothetical protein Ct9H300mP28_29260 [Pseudomonadota bacterium]|nr:MAG: hypothetical protein Ct9H300mP28_29260 [Pseudomonadota bacterium]
MLITALSILLLHRQNLGLLTELLHTLKETLQARYLFWMKCLQNGWAITGINEKN